VVVEGSVCQHQSVYLKNDSAHETLATVGQTPPPQQQGYWSPKPEEQANGIMSHPQPQQTFNNWDQSCSAQHSPPPGVEGANFCDYGQFPHYSPQSTDVQQQQHQQDQFDIEAMASHAVTELSALSVYDTSAETNEITYTNMNNVVSEGNNVDIVSQSMRVAFGDGFQQPQPPQQPNILPQQQFVGQDQWMGPSTQQQQCMFSQNMEQVPTTSPYNEGDR